MLAICSVSNIHFLCGCQALSLDSRNIEALSLKGQALMEVKKTSEAISHYREALRLAPYRYDAYNSMFHTFNDFSSLILR